MYEAPRWSWACTTAITAPPGRAPTAGTAATAARKLDAGQRHARSGGEVGGQLRGGAREVVAQRAFLHSGEPRFAHFAQAPTGRRLCGGRGGGTDERGVARPRERIPGPVENTNGEVKQPGRVGVGGDGASWSPGSGSLLHNLRPLHPLLSARGWLQPRAGVHALPHERSKRMFTGFRVGRAPR